MVDVHTISGAQPTQMDLTNSSSSQGASYAQGANEKSAQGGPTTDEQPSKPDSAAVDAAKAAALAFLAKKTGGAAVSAAPSDDIPVHSFDDVPIEDMEESYVSSLDDIPPHPLESVTVISEDGEVLERPMDSGAHIEVEAVPKSNGGEQQQGTPYQGDGHEILSQAPIEVAPIDSVTVAREYAWDPANMTEEERK